MELVPTLLKDSVNYVKDTVEIYSYWLPNMESPLEPELLLINTLGSRLQSDKLMGRRTFKLSNAIVFCNLKGMMTS